MPRFTVRAIAEMEVLADSREAACEFIRQLIEDEQWTIHDADVVVEEGSEGNG